ncbi:hypothetical protein LUZ60_002715 [Juncus effusus]|nr:hypothetical protein LUZ60_002715 [Juncus effusus]
MLAICDNTIQKTYYEILSVSEDANYEEIRMNYKSALLNTHPDKLQKYPSSSDDDQNFLIVQKAWEILGDLNSRAQYDKELRDLRRKVVVIASEIELGEMDLEINDGNFELIYPCRCGDNFCINYVELRDLGVILGENGEVQEFGTGFVPVSVVLPCGSCSLNVRLLIEKSI